MWQRVSTDDIRRAGGDALQAQCGHEWDVCDSYRIIGGGIVAEYASPPRTLPPEASEPFEPGKWRRYRPLEEAPDLFLQLAALHEQTDFIESALAFSHKYGVIGNVSAIIELGPIPDVSKVGLTEFRQEAERAWYILRMYEAVLNQAADSAGNLLEGCSDPMMDLVPAVRSGLNYKHGLHESERSAATILEDALFASASMVQMTIGELCRPSISLPRMEGREAPDASGVQRAWSFGSLLGAAYLQMYWLMTSGGDLIRCKYCGRIISRARPHPGGRKPRNDKKYCNRSHLQAHWRERKKQSS